MPLISNLSAFKAGSLFFIGMFLVSPASHALFDRLIKQDIQADILPLLNAPSLERRYFATNVLLNFPELSLPIIRKAIQDPQWQVIHWRLAYLLGTLGTQVDIPLLLKAMPQNTTGFQMKIWKGAAEKLFWRHRGSPSRNFIISRLKFLPEAQQEDRVRGQLFFIIVNPDSEGRLIEAHFNLWHVQLEHPLPNQYYWIESGDSLEVYLPITFTSQPGRDTLRINMKVREVGQYERVTPLQIARPFPAPQNQE